MVIYDMKTFKNLKMQLMFQSMAPMFFVVFILNLRCYDNCYNCVCTLISEVLLFVAIVYSIIIFIKFKYFSTISGDLPYEIINADEEEDASLSFFLTYVLPISIYNLNDWQNILAFLAVVAIMFLLMSKTNLYYANPILNLCGYKVYHIIFFNNEKTLTVLTLYNFSKGKFVSLKKIEDEVYIGILKEK